jgi:two-component system chemotaxis response regulator CheY
MKKRILIADDCMTICKIMSKILTEARYQVVGIAQDGDVVVEMFDRLKPDLVLMDVVLPKESGIEAMRQILVLDKKARVVMVSGLYQETIIMDAMFTGALDYLVKPFVAKELLMAVERALFGEEFVLNRSVNQVD